MGFKPSSMGPIEEKMQRGMVGRLIEDDTASPPIGRAAKDEVTESCPVGIAVTDDVTESSPIGRAAKDEVTESGPTAEAYQLAEIHPWSHHRDGTIYKNMNFWKSDQCIDVTNRDETQLEPMRFTVATNDCYIDAQDCLGHLTCDMLQIFSLNLAKTTIKSGPIQLYGYIAARDDVDFMLNYVFNRSRDDPIIVQQGSFIEVTGPKRGIQMNCSVLFEFDMRIRNEKKGEDDLQLIDGITELNEMFFPCKQSILRINGDCGAIDMSLGIVYNGVEATVEVAISELVSAFDLSLSCDLCMLEERGKFQLFCGTIGEPCGLRRFVIAVTLNTVMHLKFKVDKKGSNVVEHLCSFEAKQHACASHQIKCELANISVKVTWSTL
uniref:DUF6598 domain-containing protein n=1 Tax=Oryza punctata TaxID=4537 RepID=A0A0E0L0Y8_ORYPU